MAFALKLFTCLVLTVCIAASVDASISCLEVELIMFPCTSYLTGSGGDVPSACCASVNALNNMAQSTEDRQQTCRCLQSASKTIPGISAALSATLPAKCGVHIPYPITLTFDCNKVKGSTA